MTQGELGDKAPERRSRLHPPPSAAKYLGGFEVSTLAKWRVYGTGPVFVKIGKRVFYEESALDAFIDQGRRTSTSVKAA
jgi:hypothetical protein